MKALISVISILAVLGMYAGSKKKYMEVPDSAEQVPVPPFIDLEKADFSEAPEEYEIIPGDTLWDLSGKYLKSPWYWPKLWSVNPQVKNPHLIYVGDKLFFKSTGQLSLASEDDASSGKTLDNKPDSYKGFVGLGGKYRIDKFKQVDDTVFDMPKAGFLTEKDIEAAGNVIAFFDKKTMVATEDTCYANTGDKVSVGDYVEFFNSGTDLIHPVTGKKFGSYIKILGKGKITDINKDGIATIKIVKSSSEIEIGTRVRKWEDFEKNIKITETTTDVQANIISGYDPIIFLGEGHLIFIDKGSKDGLKAGNQLTVYKRADAATSKLSEEEITKLPYEMVGEIVIVKTEETASTAVITKSLLEIERGDIVKTGGMN